MSDLPRIILNIPASAAITFQLSDKYIWSLANHENDDGSSRISVIATEVSKVVMVNDEPDMIIDLRVDGSPARLFSEDPSMLELCEEMKQLREDALNKRGESSCDGGENEKPQDG